MKISIIIPIYNVELYLNQCVDSVLNQTYRDIEVLLIDDGSEDSCPYICDQYAIQDSRVRVVHQKNGGLAKARQQGICFASGQYVMFVDGDDWIEPDTLAYCAGEVSNDDDIDCLLFSYIREYPERSIPAHIMDQRGDFCGKKVQEFIHRRLFGLIGQELSHPERLENLGSCCCKLYRKSVALQGKAFHTKEVGSSEDVLFNIYALQNCQKVVYRDQLFYHYRKTGKSITSTYRSCFVEQWNRLFDIMEKYIKQNMLGMEYQEALNNRIALSVFGIGINELLGESTLAMKRKHLFEYLSSDRYQYAIKQLDIKLLPFAWKVLLWNAKHRYIFLTLIELYVADIWRRKH